MSRSFAYRCIGRGILGAVTVFVMSPAAHAYCRTHTCDPMNAEDDCDFDKHGCVTTGEPLYWRDGIVEVWAGSVGSPLRGITGADTVGALKKGYAAWMSAQCENGENPLLDVTVGGQIENAVARYAKDSPNNHNVVVFLDNDWPYDASAVAITTMTFDVNTGRIVDGDTECNSHDYAFSVNPRLPSDVDLQAVLTHEGGHVLGLAHSDVPGATMKAEAPGSGFLALRTLAADDVAGICAIYDPADEGAAGCSCSVGKRLSQRSNCVVALLVTAFASLRRAAGYRSKRVSSNGTG